MIQSDYSKASAIASEGQTAFDFRFPVLDGGHLEVWTDDVKLASSAFSATLSGSSGGTVTLAVPPGSGAKVSILRNVPFTQMVDLQNNAAFYAETLEKALDKQMMALQQLKEEVGRCVKFGPNQESVSPEDLQLLKTACLEAAAACEAAKTACEDAAATCEAADTAATAAAANAAADAETARDKAESAGSAVESAGSAAGAAAAWAGAAQAYANSAHSAAVQEIQSGLAYTSSGGVFLPGGTITEVVSAWIQNHHEHCTHDDAGITAELTATPVPKYWLVSKGGAEWSMPISMLGGLVMDRDTYLLNMTDARYRSGQRVIENVTGETKHYGVPMGSFVRDICGVAKRNGNYVQGGTEVVWEEPDKNYYGASVDSSQPCPYDSPYGDKRYLLVLPTQDEYTMNHAGESQLVALANMHVTSGGFTASFPISQTGVVKYASHDKSLSFAFGGAWPHFDPWGADSVTSWTDFSSGAAKTMGVYIPHGADASKPMDWAPVVSGGMVLVPTAGGFIFVTDRPSGDYQKEYRILMNPMILRFDLSISITF